MEQVAGRAAVRADAVEVALKMLRGVVRRGKAGL
jgi:hypothetical protein